MTDLFTALALAIAIEGVAYALFPDGMKGMMRQVQELSATTLRGAGLTATVF
ncbi:MAG: DUF2065 domain-containing protein, partial [Pseudomonadota bacterium]|nr:DUF2065 domain-containing protein [Pseudomonadota bacterium]